MDRISVSSSNLEAVGYDREKRILEVEFKNGSVYQYHDVPADVYHNLISASSVGKYFNANVRDSYSYS